MPTKDELAAIGAQAVRGQLRRQELIAELEKAAERFEKQASAQPYAVSELKSYYRQKARNARARAKELREGKA